jgi:hypothetical protein
MKKRFILLSVAIVMNMSIVKPSEALMINFGEIASIVVKYTQVMSDYMQKALEIATQMKQVQTQGIGSYASDFVNKIAGNLKYEISNYARQQLQQQIEGSKAKMVNYLDKKRQEHENAEKIKQEKKMALVKQEMDNAHDVCGQKGSELDFVAAYLKRDKTLCENASEKEKESMCAKYAETEAEYERLTYEVEEYCSREEELRSIYGDGLAKTTGNYLSMVDKAKKISSKVDYEYKKLNDKFESSKNNITGKVTKFVDEEQLKLLGATSSSNGEISSTTESLPKWDDYENLSYPSADTYKEFLNTYFYNTEGVDSEQENKFKSYQADIDIITRTRRYLLVNSAAHLLQVGATTRREIPTRSQSVKDAYEMTSQGNDELTAITAYTNTKIEATRALLLYAKLLSAKLQYQAAHKLVDIDLEKAWKDDEETYKNYQNLNLNNFIMTKEFVKSLLPKTKVEKE